MSKEKEVANHEDEPLIAENQEEIKEEVLDESNPLSEDSSEERNMEAELGEAKDKYLRLYSEFENFRRRTAKERIELIGTAGKEVLEAMIPVLDDFERAIKAGDEAGSEIEGVKLIYNKFKGIMEGKGLKKMEIKVGDAFDEDYHEAITQIPPPSKKLAGKIVDVIEPGYFLSEKVLRFAKVVTGSKE